ncbi:HD domain-containing protein [Streptomyces anulatus]|uniref:HD domain-containing protein n=1 Tax=Streptomyces anulatus TaxID=1892 RepID=UPI0020B69235|nr:HD domain-containing protein [Streptomyces anulatus]
MHDELPPLASVDDVRALAERAHAGQVDKIGVAHFAHVQAVAAGLAPFGDTLVMAGLLHDVVEDTDWTVERLLAAGVPGPVVTIVEAVTNQEGVRYEDKIRRITRDPLATLVKIADNAHNSRADRAAQLPAAKRDRLSAKYRAARAELWPSASRSDVEAIARIVNPALLTELDEHLADTSSTTPDLSADSSGTAAVSSQKR